jgi:hypothetical protein
MNQSKNSYFVNDSQIADLSRKVVEMFYKNSKIASYKHSGKTLTGSIGILLNRPISSIYSNIDGHTSLSMILKNAIHFSILTNSNATLEAEFKPIREATERKKNQLEFFERKKKKNEETGVEDEKTLLDIETTQAEIKLLEEKLDQIASAAGPPIVNSSILNLAKRVYEILLRGDRTSQNLYVEICRNLGITINIADRFFEKTMDHFINAAIYNEKDTMKSISSRIALGRVFQGGTGSFDLLLDINKLENSEYTVNETGGRLTFLPLEEEPLINDMMKYNILKTKFYIPK